MPARKDFISFISATHEKKKLVNDFFLQENAEDLYEFFQKNGYTDIPKEDCQRILHAMVHLRGHQIPPKGMLPCPPQAGY